MNDPLDPIDSEVQRLETLKRQAKQRFIGAAILLLLAVIAIPFVLGSAPRAISSDIVIDIPKMDVEPTKPTASAPTTTAKPAEPPAPASVASQVAPLVFAPEQAQAQAPTPVLAPTKPTAKALPPKQEDGAKAAALLDGASVKSKYVVQAGSYTDDAKLQAASKKLTQAGIAHFTQAATTKDGSPRTRLRLVGPFETRELANAAAAKVNQLGIQTIVLKP